MRGIDLQTLFTRLSSFAKHHAATNKAAEVNQMQLAAVEQHQVRKRERSVAKSERSERGKLQHGRRDRKSKRNKKSGDGRGQFIDISMP